MRLVTHVIHTLVRSGSSHSSLLVAVLVAVLVVTVLVVGFQRVGEAGAVLVVGFQRVGEAGGDAGGDGVPEVERVAEAPVDPVESVVDDVVGDVAW